MPARASPKPSDCAWMRRRCCPPRRPARRLSAPHDVAQLAAEALQLAQHDIDRSRPDQGWWRRRGGGNGNGWGGGRGSGGGDVVTGVLGGLVIGGSSATSSTDGVGSSGRAAADPARSHPHTVMHPGLEGRVHRHLTEAVSSREPRREPPGW
jgi:hypothetical protein